jgi:hypothetical protein
MNRNLKKEINKHVVFPLVPKPEGRLPLDCQKKGKKEKKEKKDLCAAVKKSPPVSLQGPSSRLFSPHPLSDCNRKKNKDKSGGQEQIIKREKKKKKRRNDIIRTSTGKSAGADLDSNGINSRGRIEPNTTNGIGWRVEPSQRGVDIGRIPQLFISPIHLDCRFISSLFTLHGLLLHLL